MRPLILCLPFLLLSASQDESTPAEEVSNKGRGEKEGVEGGQEPSADSLEGAIADGGVETSQEDRQEVVHTEGDMEELKEREEPAQTPDDSLWSVDLNELKKDDKQPKERPSEEEEKGAREKVGSSKSRNPEKQGLGKEDLSHAAPPELPNQPPPASSPSEGMEAGKDQPTVGDEKEPVAKVEGEQVGENRLPSPTSLPSVPSDDPSGTHSAESLDGQEGQESREGEGEALSEVHLKAEAKDESPAAEENPSKLSQVVVEEDFLVTLFWVVFSLLVVLSSSMFVRWVYIDGVKRRYEALRLLGEEMGIAFVERQRSSVSEGLLH